MSEGVDLTDAVDVERVDPEHVLEIVERIPRAEAERRFEWGLIEIERSKAQKQFLDVARILVTFLQDEWLPEGGATLGFLRLARMHLEELKRIEAERKRWQARRAKVKP